MDWLQKPAPVSKAIRASSTPFGIINPQIIAKGQKRIIRTTGGGDGHQSQADHRMHQRSICGRSQQVIVWLCEQNQNHHAQTYTINTAQGD